MDGPEAWRGGEQERAAFDTTLYKAIAQKERLAVRLGRNHEITMLYDETLDCALANYRFLREAALAGANGLREESTRQMKDFQKASDAFADAAHTAAGSRT